MQRPTRLLLPLLASLLLPVLGSAQDYSGLQLDETHLLLNAYASPAELASPYVAASLQTLGELSADRRTLTLPAGTTVYIARLADALYGPGERGGTAC